MTNQLHQATAILRDGVLRVEGFPNAEPVKTFYYGHRDHANWLASKVSYPVSEQSKQDIFIEIVNITRTM